eukprot:scaffold848_cov54-Attheya_sp.AAC.2
MVSCTRLHKVICGSGFHNDISAPANSSQLPSNNKTFTHLESAKIYNRVGVWKKKNYHHRRAWLSLDEIKCAEISGPLWQLQSDSIGVILNQLNCELNKIHGSGIIGISEAALPHPLTYQWRHEYSPW